jgi:hypothetical protein
MVRQIKNRKPKLLPVLKKSGIVEKADVYSIMSLGDTSFARIICVIHFSTLLETPHLQL